MAKRIVVASGKGGVGKTTLALALSLAFARRGKRVLLVDFDDLRCADLLLGVADRVVYDWGDVLNQNCEPNDALLDAGAISLLPCPTDYGTFTPAQVREMMRGYAQQFDVLMFDAPAGIGTGFSLACAAARTGIVVALPDPTSVRSACRTAQEMESQGVKETRLILNRAVKRDIRRGLLLNIDDVIDRSEVQLIGIVPEDRALRYAAMKPGFFSPDAISFLPLSSIAGRLEGENIPLIFS